MSNIYHLRNIFSFIHCTILFDYLSRIYEVCVELGSQISANARIEAPTLGPKNRAL